MVKKIKTLYSAADIHARLDELAEKINGDYKGEEVTIVGVLKGSFIFMADLVKKLNMPVRCDFLRVASYEADKPTGIVRVELDITQSIKGQNVLLVEDIVDSGRTLGFLLKHLGQQDPKTLKVCTLLHKADMGADRRKLNYVGFTVPNKFVVGYGLDSMGLYRNLPYIGYFE